VRASGRLRRLLGATACSGDGATIGPVTALFVDDASGEPVWAAVRLGPAAGADRLVPLARSWLFPGGRLLVPATHRTVEDAPALVARGLGPEHEETLLRHYARVLAPRVRSAAPRRLVRYDAVPAGEDRGAAP
jgi:hypothetical protein